MYSGTWISNSRDFSRLSDCLLEILLSSGVKNNMEAALSNSMLKRFPGNGFRGRLCIPLSPKKSFTKELCMLSEQVCTRVHQIHSPSRGICHEMAFFERNPFRIRSVTGLLILQSERAHGGPNRSSEQCFLRRSIPISTQL